MGTPLSATGPSSTNIDTVGEDLLGWSALPLLCPAHSGSWLFVTASSAAWRSRGSLADASFENVWLSDHRPWPFETRSLAGVVIDGDMVARSADEAAIEHCIEEAYRVAVTDAHVLIACGERRMPRRLRDLRDYRGRSAHVWRKALVPTRDISAAASVDLDGDRLTEIALPGDADAESSAGTHSSRLVLKARAADERGTLQRIVAATSSAVGTGVQIERIAVRKIGKTAVFLSGADGRRFIVRIARSPIARRRATRNFEAIRSLHASSLPKALIEVIPRAVARGTCEPYDYFVEECLTGHGGLSEGTRRQDGWAREPAEFLSALHETTAQPVLIGDSELQRLILEPIERLSRACGSESADRVLRRVSVRCEEGLRGRTLPLVRTHGDFTESNCLFDGDGRLSGVVDWEVSEERGLPLLDLLQLLPVAGEDSRAARWRRFDAWMDLFRQPHDVLEDPVMGRYVRSMDVEAGSIPALLLAQWVTHAADRAAVRRADDRWMRLRVWQPLETLGRMLCD
jgi:aminoglycoside phosphotransferase (APT) family kinase protein